MARSASGFQSRRFIEGLRGTQVNALREAVLYLLRGEGKHRTDLVGVDHVDVQNTREFGRSRTTLDAERLRFEQVWATNRGRMQLQRAWDPRCKHRTSDCKDYYRQRWMQEAAVDIQNEYASAEFLVTFSGSTGTWTTTFVLGCREFTNAPYVHRDEDRFELNGVVD